MQSDDDANSEQDKAADLGHLDDPGYALAKFLEQQGLADTDRRERDLTLNLAQTWFDPAEENPDGLLTEMRERAEQRYGWTGA